jgi:iodotyrosine deiodinase
MSTSRERLEFVRIAEQEQFRLSLEFLARMRQRRTVREFSSEAVPFALIENAVRAAATAPSGANQQPWRFVVVGAPEMKRRIREAAEAEEKENYTRRFPPDWLEALQPFGTDWQKEFLETAPWLIVVFRIDFGLEGDQRTKHYYVQESVGIATGILLTALHLSGLATLTHTPSPMGFLTQLLDRPANERPFLLIPVGYPAPEATIPTLAKKPVEEILIVR